MILVSLAVPAIVLIMPGSPARAATYFQLENAQSLGCIQETGTQSGVWMGGCGSNHSDYWNQSPADSLELVNEHSGYCLIVTGQNPGVWLSGCTPGVTVMEWKITAYPRGVLGGYKITNQHTGWCLTYEPSQPDVIDQARCDTSQSPYQTWYKTSFG
jgi:hypothetical protein